MGTQVFHQDLLSLLGMGAERKERTQHVVCYRTGDGTGVLDLKERRKGEDLSSLPASLAYFLPWLGSPEGSQSKSAGDRHGSKLITWEKKG